jgi:hypothetical protein
MRLLPERNFRVRLRPVNHSGFITPVKQPSHSRPVGFRTHECLQEGLGRPTRAGPERVPAIPQQFDREVAVGPRGLPSNSQRLNEDRREIGSRPNAKTRDGDDDWHKLKCRGGRRSYIGGQNYHPNDPRILNQITCTLSYLNQETRRHWTCLPTVIFYLSKAAASLPPLVLPIACSIAASRSWIDRRSRS